MSFNLLDAVKNQFSGDMVSKASSLLGENEGAISKALSGIIPSALTGIISKAGSGGQGAESILSMAKSAAGGGGGLSGFFGDGGGGLLSKGLDMVKGLFGDKFGGILSAISSFAGIKSSSASSLFSMAAPAAMSSVGSYASQNNLNSSGLLSFLNSQKSSILNSLPAGLSSITSLLGMGGAAKAISSATEETVQRTGGGMKWLLPLLLLAALLAWWFLLGGKSSCNKKSDAATSDTAVVSSMDDTAGKMTTPTVSTPESFMVKLPDGTELNAYKGGIEDKLVSFLNTDWMKLGEESLKNTWFDFDNLNFKTGSAEITAESQQQVNNMVAILKAFPKAKLKIGGYTDKVGNEAANKKLSGERANAVKAAMDKAGVGAQVTGAEGYGSEFAKYPADAPESERVKDRHVSVSVRG